MLLPKGVRVCALANRRASFSSNWRRHTRYSLVFDEAVSRQRDQLRLSRMIYGLPANNLFASFWPMFFDVVAKI